MAGFHQRACSDHVSPPQRLRCQRYPYIASDDVEGAPVGDLGQVCSHPLQVVQAHVAQGVDAGQKLAQSPYRLFALSTPHVVLRGGQSPPYPRVRHDDGHALRQWHGFHLQRTAI